VAAIGADVKRSTQSVIGPGPSRSPSSRDAIECSARRGAGGYQRSSTTTRSTRWFPDNAVPAGRSARTQTWSSTAGKSPRSYLHPPHRSRLNAGIPGVSVRSEYRRRPAVGLEVDGPRKRRRLLAIARALEGILDPPAPKPGHGRSRAD